MSRPSIVLAIESAINGGSISLMSDGAELSHWIGSSSVSKAEELLININELLISTRVSKADISLIAVSAGPGSFTGVRIGLATALGLKNGLEIEMSSVSALTAMAASVAAAGKVIAAVPTGRHAICIQEFQSGHEPSPINEPHTINEEEFVDLLSKKRGVEFVLHGSLCSDLAPPIPLTDAGNNIAGFIGRYCSDRPPMITKPLFISKNF